MGTNDRTTFPARGLSRVAIGGCGRTGAAIAAALSRPGRTIYVLDVFPDAFDNLPDDVVQKGLVMPYLADMTLESELRFTGVQDVDVFIATAGRDAVNILAAQIARHILGVRSVICRLNDPVKREMYEKLELATIGHTEILKDLVLQRI